MMRNVCRTCFVSLLLILMLVGTSRDVWAASRVALVIGNAKYVSAPPLATPANDAADVAQHLRAIGFDVIEQSDASRDAMAKAIHAFRGRLRGAEIALFFYAGHSVQLNGSNFLVPVDGTIENSADVRFDTIDLGDIQKEMDGSGRTSILLLDASRANPFADKLKADGGAATANGVAPIETAPGSLVVSAAQPNSLGQDGTGRNSPFTAALLAHLDTPGQEIREMVAKIRTDVLHASGHRQAPWDKSALTQDVDLVPPTAEAAAAPAAAPPPVASPAPAVPEPVASAAAPPSPPVAPEPPAAPAPQAEAAPPAPDTPAPADSSHPPPDGLPVPLTAAAPAKPKNDCDRLAALRTPVFSANGTHDAPPVDWSRAVQACQEMMKANPNEIRFVYQLGRAYDNLKDYIPAVHYYQIAADANFAEAQNDLGVAYYNGHGVVRNFDAAFSLVNEAAEQGSARGLANLSALYADGKGVRKDNAKSLELAEKAVEAGNPFALVVIGNHYFNGAGADRDYKMAAQYFQQASDLGNAYAMKILANMYANGYLGASDLAKAGELRYRAQQVDPTSADPTPLAPYRAASRRTYRTAVRRRYIVYRRFFGFGGCVYVCF